MVDDALERVGLADRADDRLATYSLGKKQRLALQAGAALPAGDPAVDPDFMPSDVEDVITNRSVLIRLGFIVGASFIGAGWQAGVIPTILSWETRQAHTAIPRHQSGRDVFNV